MKTHFKASILALSVAAIGIAFAGRDGSGTYTLPVGNPVSTGTTISSTWANSTLTDIATALSNSIAKDGQTVATANLPMGGFKHTNVANASARNHYIAAGQVQDFSTQKLGSVAGTNTITGNLNPAITAYLAGMLIDFQPANTNTGATTLAVNGLTALDILKCGVGSCFALVAGDLVAGVPAVLVLESGGVDWILLNPQSANLITGTAISDLARLSQSNTFTAVGSNASPNIGLSSTLPIFILNETGAAADNRRWKQQATGACFQATTLNDANNAGAVWLEACRSGTTVSTINLQATAVQINGATLPKHAYGLVTESGAACTLSGSDASAGISAVAYASVAGRCTITLNAGFATRPICTATPNTTAGNRIAMIECSSSTSCTLHQLSSFSTAASATSNVQCIGT